MPYMSFGLVILIADLPTPLCLFMVTCWWCLCVVWCQALGPIVLKLVIESIEHS